MAEGNVEGAVQVREQARRKVVACLTQLDTQMQGAGGPWLLGSAYGAADAYAFMLCRWTRNSSEGAARGFAHLRPSLQRMSERSAVQQTFEIEGLGGAPYS